MAALKELKDSGKIKYIGVCELEVDEIRRASAVVKVDVLQIEVGASSTHEIIINSV